MIAQALPRNRQAWLDEVVATLGFIQRNYYLTKRYFLWELVWLVYTTANAMSIGFIGVGVEQAAGSDTGRITTYLLIGALIWSFLSMLFDVLSETVSWERWEGTIEYTFMAPASRATHLIGTGVYAVIYGIARTAVMFVAIALVFDLEIEQANYLGALLVLVACSISLVGFGMCAAVMPLLSPEKGSQVVFIFGSVLLLISGVYYPVDVLPEWMQSLSKLSPVTYALEGIRAALLDNAGYDMLWDSILPCLVLGVILVPLGLWIFTIGERFAKRTGRLKRSG